MGLYDIYSVYIVVEGSLSATIGVPASLMQSAIYYAITFYRGTEGMNTPLTKRSLLLAVALVLLPAAVFSSHDQTSTERILKENKEFVEFINISVTNFAGGKKEDFKKIYEKHFNADIAYLQSDYKRAFERVYTSQGEMEGLYRNMVKEYYLEDSKSILDRLAPGIIRSKSARARLYLTLGYRDRTVSWVHYTVGDASNPKLYSYKLYKYVDAIKMARRAKRFAFLALFESQPVEVKKKIYNQLCKTERDSGNKFMGRFIDLNEQDYITEIAKDYEAYQKAEDASVDKSGARPTDPTFEKKVERRVRFRNETKAARYLLNGEFDQAEDLMRPYIEDFNFKIIFATFDVLTAAEKAGGAKGEAIDYEKYKVHQVDNYSRFSNKSILDEVIDMVKVEDDITVKGEGTKPDGGTKPPEEKGSGGEGKVEGKIE